MTQNRLYFLLCNVRELKSNEGGPPRAETIPPSHVLPLRRYPLQLNFLSRGNSTEFLFALLILRPPRFYLEMLSLALFRCYDLGSHFYRIVYIAGWILLQFLTRRIDCVFICACIEKWRKSFAQIFRKSYNIIVFLLN